MFNTSHRFMLRSTFSTFALALTLGNVAACESAVDDKAKAKVEAAEKVDDKAGDEKAGDEKAGDEKPGAKTLALDTASSKVGFIGAKVVGDHTGSFENFTGSASVEGDKLTALELTVETNSVKTDADPDLGGHLMGDDFFDSAKHPQAKFTLLSAEAKTGEGGATHELAGNLEIRGKANKVTFPGTVTISDAGVTGKAEFSINRKLWGIDYAGKADNLIKDDVAMILELNFK